MVWFDIGILWNWMPVWLRKLWQQHRIRIYHQQDFFSGTIVNTIWICSPMLERKGCAVQDDLGC